MHNRTLLKGVVILAAAAGATAAIASRNPAPRFAAKMAPFVLKAIDGGSENIPVLVELRAQANIASFDNVRMERSARLQGIYDALRTVAIETQAPLVELIRSRDLKFRRFYISNMIAVYGANSQFIEELAGRQDVARVLGNPAVQQTLPGSSLGARLSHIFSGERSSAAPGDNITFLRANQIWSTYNKQGEGIVVAGQDSGVEWDHPALVRQYRGTSDGNAHVYNWHDAVHADIPIRPRNPTSCGYDVEVPCDDSDHGTHTMGTMVGSDGGNIVGLAPKAKWIACKNMDNGLGTPASYIECFEWLLAPYAFGANPMTDGKPEKAPHIINNSWGCPTEEGCLGDEVIPALKAMKTAGIMVVVSAGNEGAHPDNGSLVCRSIKNSPAYHSALTFTVGALDHRSGTIAQFSSRGPSLFDGGKGPDVVAPGVDINSTVRRGGYNDTFSGTSMAGPHVAGSVALIWSVIPELVGNIDATADLLRRTATPKTTTDGCGGDTRTSMPNNTYGYGVIDPLKAIQTYLGQTTTSTPARTGTGSTWPRRARN